MPANSVVQAQRTLTGTPVKKSRQSPAKNYYRPVGPARRSRSNPSLNAVVADYSPTRQGDKAGSAIGGLEAEFIGGLILVFITVFTDTSSTYSAKMLAVMKRGSMLAITFFILSLLSSSGQGAARFAKAFGALIVVAILMADASSGMIDELDKLFNADWKGNKDSGTGDSSADAQAGTPQSTGIVGAISGILGKAKGAPQGVLGDIEQVGGDAAKGIGDGIRNGIFP